MECVSWGREFNIPPGDKPGCLGELQKCGCLQDELIEDVCDALLL